MSRAYGVSPAARPAQPSGRPPCPIAAAVDAGGEVGRGDRRLRSSRPSARRQPATPPARPSPRATSAPAVARSCRGGGRRSTHWSAPAARRRARRRRRRARQRRPGCAMRRRHRAAAREAQHRHRRRAPLGDQRSRSLPAPVEHGGPAAQEGGHHPPGSAMPSYGVLRDSDGSPPARPYQLAAGSISTRFAGSPTAIGRPWPASRRSGPAARTSARPPRASPAGRSRPSSACTTDSAVSSPSMPGLALSHSVSLSCTACGAWSVATMSITPSASAGAQRRRRRRPCAAAGSP